MRPMVFGSLFRTISFFLLSASLGQAQLVCRFTGGAASPIHAVPGLPNIWQDPRNWEVVSSEGLIGALQERFFAVPTTDKDTAIIVSQPFLPGLFIIGVPPWLHTLIVDRDSLVYAGIFPVTVGRMEISGKSLLLFERVIVDDLVLDNSTLQFDNPGELTINRRFEWKSGRITGGKFGGTIRIAEGATMVLTSSDVRDLVNVKIENHGVILWENGHIRWDKCTLNNRGLIEIQADGSLAAFKDKDGNATPVLHNWFDGTIRKTEGEGIFEFKNDEGGYAVENEGKIEPLSGTLLFPKNLRLNNDSRIEGAGGIVEAIDPLYSGEIELADGGTLRIPNGITARRGGNVPHSGHIRINGGLLDWPGGYLDAVNVGGLRITVEPGGVLQAGGNAAKRFLQGVWVDVAGKLLWAGAGHLELQGVTLNILDGGILEVAGDAATVPHALRQELIVSSKGAIRKTNGTGVTTWNGWDSFILDGAMETLTGSFEVAGAMQARNGSSFRGRTWLAKGSAQAQLSGTLTIDGTLEIVGEASLVGVASLAGAGQLLWKGGWIDRQLPGARTELTLTPGFHLNIEGNDQKVLVNNAILDNRGVITWRDPGPLMLSGCVIHNRAGALFDIQNDSKTDNPPVPNGPNYFTNYAGGIIRKSFGGSAGTLFSGWGHFHNAGKLELEFGTLILARPFTFSNGTLLTGDARCRVASDGLLQGTTSVNSKLELVEGGRLHGSATIDGVGLFSWTGGSIGTGDLNNRSRITWAAVTPLALDGNATKYLDAAVLTNLSTVTWKGAGNLSFVRASELNNAGTFQMLTDASLEGSVFNNLGSGAIVKSGSPGATTLNRVTLNNRGKVVVESGSVVLERFCEANFEDGSRLQGPGPLTVKGTAVLQGALTLEAGSNLQLAGGASELKFIGQGLVKGPGLFSWTAGSIGAGDPNNRSRITWAADTQLVLDGAADKYLDGAVLTNLGTITWKGTGNLSLLRASEMNNAGTFQILTDASLNGAVQDPVFNNLAAGVLAKSGSTGVTTLSGVLLKNSGIMEVKSGEILIRGDYASGASSSHLISISGKTARTQYGVVGATGRWSFGGRLKVALPNDYTPVSGDSFSVFNYGSSAGQFSLLDLPTLPGGLTWNSVYGPSALTLSIGQETSLGRPTVLPNGNFQFQISGPAGARLVIQASTDLKEWTSITTNAPFNGEFTFTDPRSLQAGRRFYRISIQP
ncbi:MAG: hypothetical protein HY735_06175 [Verrucomicrobia bacterium]|nr:hypothetical protein [Verrucomicrobiota bacterium]